MDAVTDAMTRGPQPVPADARRARAARSDRRQDRGAVRPHATTPASEITITAGATQAIITAILAVVHPGDEVIVLEPCYDSYVPNIELAGGTVVRVPLTPGTFRPDFDKIAAAHHAATRAIIINSPHNPSATVWTRERHAAAAGPAGAHRRAADQRRGLRAHGVRRRAQHQSAARFPGLAARALHRLAASARPTT